MRIGYPAVYHTAIAHLIEHAPHEGDTTRGRRLCAAALRALRARDRAWARRERYHMARLGGRFPYKYNER